MDERRDEPPLPQRTRRQVAKDVLVFQVKLFLDGLRDVLLFPASLLLGAFGVVFSRRPGEPFYRLLRTGKATERWLDLFGDAYVAPEDEPTTERSGDSWRLLEQQLRELDTSLRDGDYKGAAREGTVRIRQTIRRFLNHRQRKEPQ